MSGMTVSHPSSTRTATDINVYRAIINPRRVQHSNTPYRTISLISLTTNRSLRSHNTYHATRKHGLQSPPIRQQRCRAHHRAFAAWYPPPQHPNSRPEDR